MRTAYPLPEALSIQAKWTKPLLTEAGVLQHQYGFALARPSDIEQHLAQLRLAHIDVLECSLEKPDLEDVFVQLMQGVQS